MRVFILFVFTVVSISLGYQLYTEDAFVKSGGGKLSDDPVSFYSSVIFEGMVWLTLLVCLFLSNEKLNALNEWLKTLDSKYDDKS